MIGKIGGYVGVFPENVIAVLEGRSEMMLKEYKGMFEAIALTVGKVSPVHSRL